MPNPQLHIAKTSIFFSLVFILPLWLSVDQKTLPLKSKDFYLRKWLEQDVVYLITDGERTSFCKLKTDEQRYKFIEEFWRKRNPSPGKEENEFRDEHYRRIAFANEHFTLIRPGCLTDRGRIYILNGSPDQIETSPNANQHGGSPFEIWRYRQKTFRFDLTGGDYHQVTGFDKTAK